MLHTLSLTRAGLILNATRCSITSDEFQIFPELHGTTQTKVSVPTLHLPDNITVVTDFELQQLRDILPLETQKLTEVHDRVITSLQTYDVESPLHARQTSLLQEKRNNIIITTSLRTIPIISILCFVLYSHLRYGRYCVCKTDDTTISAKNHPKPEDAQGEMQGHSVLFTTYALQQAS